MKSIYYSIHDLRKISGDFQNAQAVVVKLGILHRQVDVALGPFDILFALLEQFHGEFLQGQILHCARLQIAQGGLRQKLLVFLLVATLSVVASQGKRRHGVDA